MSEAEIKPVKTDSQQIKPKSSRNTELPADKLQGNPPSLRSLRVEAEIYAISRTLEYTGWNRRKAAQLLSISYRGILYKIRQHNLSPRPRGQSEPVGEILKADSQS
ncbi:MAG TPA: helix-turn-helix domain-containing protein [Candidatus Acidoferrales bacterium]|jgi:DNA-binding NtrC family response regulator|nr:helix-turn-helix domain-containing protein [Candidatus Acidoferrales bacterium]